jgi:predicted nicotinamide N-methyase
MPRTPSPPLWSPYALAGQRFQLLNPDHPEIATRVLGDLDAGIAVYYDSRWDLTTRFCRFLLTHPAWIVGRSVLVLGAGIGLETLVIGRLCTTLYVNDRAPGALDLCAQQLRQNGITDFTCLCGSYETFDLPPVDLLVGCYLVYNRDTAAAMRQLLTRHTPPVLLCNDNLLSWQALLRETKRPYRALLTPDDFPCLLFEVDAPEPEMAHSLAPRYRRWRRGLVPHLRKDKP